MSMPIAEVKGVLASKQGLSCSGYFTLANRTVHLRERVYITVRDGEKLFLPQRSEHFPCKELERHYLGRQKLGLGESVGAKGGTVVFICEGSAADEGAAIIEATLAGLEEVLTRNLPAREAVALKQGWRYHKALSVAAAGPYRPPTLPERSGPPKPVTEEERANAPLDPARLEVHRRKYLERWGLLEAYDEMQRAQAASQRREEEQRRAAPWLGPQQVSQAINRTF